MVKATPEALQGLQVLLLIRAQRSLAPSGQGAFSFDTVTPHHSPPDQPLRSVSHTVTPPNPPAHGSFLRLFVAGRLLWRGAAARCLDYVGQDQPVELSSMSWSIGRWAMFMPLTRGGPPRPPGERRPLGTLPYCPLTIGLSAACEGGAASPPDWHG